MKYETKRNIKNLFASIIKNDAAIDGAKTAPWWIALILFIICNFIPIIPIMVNASKTYGASFLASYTNGYEQALVGAENQIKDRGDFLKIVDHELLYYKAEDPVNPVKDTYVGEADMQPIGYYNTEISGTKTRSLNIFYSDRPISNKAKTDINNMIKNLDNTKYVVGTDEKWTTEHASDAPTYVPSYLILFRTGSFSKVFRDGTTKVSSATYGGFDWKKFSNMDLIEETLSVEGIEADAKNEAYVNGVLTNWKNVFNKAYQNQKVTTFWFNSGLYYGIYLVLTIFMGFMLWLLTRGKNNPNRGLNMWITTKIETWILFTPAVLAMILGFIWSAAAGLAFIVLIGLRTMWLAMRQLTPVAQ